MLSPLPYPFYPSTENRMEINIKTTKEKEKENKDIHLKTSPDKEIVTNIKDTEKENKTEQTEWR